MSPTTVVTEYFRSWNAREFDALEQLLADDIDFVGPLAHVTGAEACRRGLEGLSHATRGAKIEKMFVDGDDVLTWYALQPNEGDAVTVANWSRVKNGRISEMRVAFDPRVFVS